MPAPSPFDPKSGSNPGSQSALRELNQQRIVRTLLDSGPSTQAELARLTGLSTATISNLVKLMGERHLVEVEPTTRSGRRALLVRLAKGDAFAVGIDFGRRHLRVMVVSRGYTVLAEEFRELEVGHHADEGLELADEIVSRLLAENDIPSSSVLGVGVGIPGPIDRRTDTVVQGAILPEWVGIPLPELKDRLHFPVVFDNDANLGALAEVTWGPHGEVDNLVFVKIGSGIGAGLILGGRPFYGGIGVTGEIGHDTITENGTVCHCGNRGCLETVASTSVMLDLLARSGAVRPADIVRLARNGDSATLRVIEDSGTAIGRALATVANLVNPEVIVVGGPLAELGDLFLAPIERGLIRHAVPSVGENTALVMSSLGEKAEALGAAALVLQQRGAENF
jgi:predicted NBD/HSP70 family sugar kinase